MEELVQSGSLQRCLSVYDTKPKLNSIPIGPKSLTSTISRTSEKKFITDIHLHYRQSSLLPGCSTLHTLGSPAPSKKNSNLQESSQRLSDFELASHPLPGDVAEMSESTPEVHESIAFIEDEEEEHKQKHSFRKKTNRSTLVKDSGSPIGGSSRRSLHDSCRDMTDTASQHYAAKSTTNTRVLVKPSGGNSNYTVQLQMVETPPGSPSMHSQSVKQTSQRRGSESIISVSSGSKQNPTYLKAPESCRLFINEPPPKPELVSRSIIQTLQEFFDILSFPQPHLKFKQCRPTPQHRRSGRAQTAQLLKQQEVHSHADDLVRHAAGSQLGSYLSVPRGWL